MINQTDLSQQLALDSQGLGKLQRNARENSPEALKAAAAQFEALFLNMMMKSMRHASGGEGGIFDSEQSRMYISMLDQQFSQSMATRGIGLADVLIRQLSSQVAGADVAEQMAGQAAGMAADKSASDKSAAAMTSPVTTPMSGRAASLPSNMAEENVAPAATENNWRRPASDQPPHVQDFQSRMGAHAEAASRVTGIPSKFILAQAALESGWGKREIVGANGERSHNVFGIKATGNWKGRTVETMTTEYVDGVAQRKVEKFRAYDSYADAFRDYARLISNNPRYQDVIAQGRDAVGFASGLQRAGYATDPNYAAKLTRIIQNNLA